jgi:threonine dehydrogenase-like Zn-dependent dehydrogenase
MSWSCLLSSTHDGAADRCCGVACQEGDEPGKLAKVRTDVVIIGGGVIGSAAAGFLRHARAAPEVVVLEPDLTYARAASPRASGGIRQLFSCPENVAMSRYTHQTLRCWRQFAGAGPSLPRPGPTAAEVILVGAV